MRSRKITHKSEFAEKIRLGIQEIASIVARTLGPGGLPILIERDGVTATGDPLGPMITKDGVTVAGECSHSDPEIDLVIQTVKAICRKTNRIAGDGTTTAIVLGESILMEALDELKSDPSLNPQLIREEIEKAAEGVQAKLKALTLPVDSPRLIEAVATISANGDGQVGAIIREAFDRVGSEGVITVDEGFGPQTTIDVVDGFQIRRGAEAQDRFFNNSDGTKFEAEKVRVILYDGKLINYTELIPPLEVLAAENRKGLPPIVIIANEFSPEVLQFLLIQRAELQLKFCAVKSPDTTSIRTGMLDDMAVMLEGYRFGNGNRTLSTATTDDIGECGKVVIDKYTATFYDGDGTDEAVLGRVNQLKAQRASAESPYDAARISDRIAALSQGIAKIGVGGLTDLEIKERYHRIEDALNAARAAVEEGIIPGGGVVLAKLGFQLHDEAKTVGEKILARALLAPFGQILRNIGEDPDAQDVEAYGPGETYDARSKKRVHALHAGIIDPVKVTRTALENAVSIAALLTTCGGGIVWPRAPEG